MAPMVGFGSAGPETAHPPRGVVPPVPGALAPPVPGMVDAGQKGPEAVVPPVVSADFRS